MAGELLACVDVDYRSSGAVAACVCFRAWDDNTPELESVVQIDQVEPYRSGEFYRRELPCILAVLDSLPDLPRVIIIDGYVWLGEQLPGLGARLYEALGARAAVIGVAKTRFLRAGPVELIHRGHSRTPLYVTAVGTDLRQAAERIRAMHGAHRIPTLLYRVDKMSR